MAFQYGIPYMGSKTKIAETILSKLPNGRRFVDLFGGGFAMTHRAMLSGKYRKFLYNDFDSRIVQLVQDAYHGKYNYKVFKPEFITREMFETRKDSDPYVLYIWSFGNSPTNGYLFGKDIEPLKHAAHDFVVFGKPSNLLSTNHMKAVKSNDIHERRMEFCGYRRKINKRLGLQRLERLERLERLQQLERLQRLQRLEFSNMSYANYEHQEGDIVYCDPPYERTSGYSDGGFDSNAFYDWVETRPYQVWFSSYKISRDFPMVYAKSIRSVVGGANNAKKVFECLYTNRR